MYAQTWTFIFNLLRKAYKENDLLQLIKITQWISKKIHIQIKELITVQKNIESDAYYVESSVSSPRLDIALITCKYFAPLFLLICYFSIPPIQR